MIQNPWNNIFSQNSYFIFGTVWRTLLWMCAQLSVDNPMRRAESRFGMNVVDIPEFVITWNMRSAKNWCFWIFEKTSSISISLLHINVLTTRSKLSSWANVRIHAAWHPITYNIIKIATSRLRKREKREIFILLLDI